MRSGECRPCPALDGEAISLHGDRLTSLMRDAPVSLRPGTSGRRGRRPDLINDAGEPGSGLATVRWSGRSGRRREDLGRQFDGHCWGASPATRGSLPTAAGRRIKPGRRPAEGHPHPGRWSTGSRRTAHDPDRIQLSFPRGEA